MLVTDHDDCERWRWCDQHMLSENSNLVGGFKHRGWTILNQPTSHPSARKSKCHHLSKQARNLTRSTTKKRRFSTELQLQLLKDDQHLTSTSTTTSTIIIIIIIILLLLLITTIIITTIIIIIINIHDYFCHHYQDDLNPDHTIVLYTRWTRDVCCCIHPTS